MSTARPSTRGTRGDGRRDGGGEGHGREARREGGAEGSGRRVRDAADGSGKRARGAEQAAAPRVSKAPGGGGAGGGSGRGERRYAAVDKRDTLLNYVRANYALALTAEIRLTLWIPAEQKDLAVNESRLWRQQLPVSLAVVVRWATALHGVGEPPRFVSVQSVRAADVACNAARSADM